jgi:hypothetical protein
MAKIKILHHLDAGVFCYNIELSRYPTDKLKEILDAVTEELNSRQPVAVPVLLPQESDKP